MSRRSHVLPGLLVGAALIGLSAQAVAEAPVSLERTNGIVYGQRDGRDLTMDIIQDIHRGVRFVRYHAEKYKIDPSNIGVTGASAGGHLSLLLATTGGPGPSDADDPIDRESSAVQAVAIFFPATDLVNMGDASINPGDGGPPLGYEAAFGLQSGDKEGWDKINQQISPIFHIKEGLPPTLIYHGDKDELVPLDQSQRYQVKAQEWNNEVKLVVRQGLAHGWLTIPVDMKAFADWYDQHLSADTPKTEAQATQGQSSP